MMIIMSTKNFLKVQTSQKMEVISLSCFHASNIVKMYFLVYHIVFYLHRWKWQTEGYHSHLGREIEGLQTGTSQMTMLYAEE